MTYWVLKLDSNLPTRPGGIRTEVSIHYPSASREQAEKTADILNEGEVEKCAQMSWQHYRPAKGTTPVSYKVISEEDLQRFYQAGVRVVRYP